MTDVEMVGETFAVPRQLGPYLVEFELGSGAMGTVFRAMHTGLDRAVALKVLRPDTLDNPASVRRFLREARSVARLDHPNIVAVYDAGQVGGIYYIAMKLLEGRTLKDVLEGEGPLSCDRAVHVARQLASALDYAHEKEVVHLDVKPANVMVASGDRVTLTDFSIAQALNPDATRSAVITGTPLYMSPEQIQGKGVDRRSDIYALGMMLFQMLSGRTPFDGPFVSVMYAHLNTPIPDIRQLVPTVPERVARAIDRATAKDPSARFQTAGEMLRALEDREAAAPPIRPAQESTVLLPSGPFKESAAMPQAPRAERKSADAAATAVAAPERRGGVGRKGLMAGVPVAVVLAAAGVFFALRGSASASPGAIAVSSVPAGASVALDGVAKGHTPLTLSGVKSGHHVLTLSAATYNSLRQGIDVGSGKTVQASYTLASWPPDRLVSANPVFLTTSLTLDRVTGQAHPGAALSSILSSLAGKSTIYTIAQFGLRSSVPPGRTVNIAPYIALYSPTAYLIGTFPPHPVAEPLDRANPYRVFFPGFHIKTRPVPVGTYHVVLRLGNQVIRKLSFSVTNG